MHCVDKTRTFELVGFGGPKMQHAGMTLHADLTQLAVMWILQAVLNIHKFWRLLRQTDQYFRFSARMLSS